jgi:hypothetical protein
MELRPRHLVAAGAVAAAGFLGLGAITAASADDGNGNGGGTTSTTVEGPSGANGGGSSHQGDHNCPHMGAEGNQDRQQGESNTAT